MSPTTRASHVWEVNGGDDVLQVAVQGGAIIAGIDSKGAGFGTLVNQSIASVSNNSIQNFLPANTVVNDGIVHTIGQAIIPPFKGISTLSQLAGLLVNGTTLYSWITNTMFTSVSGAYALTDSDVPNIDLSWLAIQSALMTGKCYIPAGTYIVGSKRKLPLYIPLAFETGTTLQSGISIKGDGPRVTIIQAGSDFGAGIPLIACGDPSGTVSNGLGRYSGNNAQFTGDLESIGFFDSSLNFQPTPGSANVAMTGFAWGARLRTKDVECSGFGKCVSLVGDHTQHIRLKCVGGTYGLYWDNPNTSLLGDLDFVSLNVSGQSQASIAVHGAASVAGGEFSGTTYLSAPYVIFGESGGTADILSGTIIQKLFMEFIGNAFIADDTGFANGTYTDANKVRSIRNTVIGTIFGTYSDSKLWTSTGRGRRASFDLNQCNMQIQNLQIDGSNFVPPVAPSGPAPIATFNLKVIGFFGIGGLRITGNTNGWSSLSGALPLFNASAQGNVTLVPI